jgi:hypothetical protein
MPKFDSKSIGGKIEYDFTEWGGQLGVVEEPSKFAVKKFLKDVQAVFKKLKVVEDDERDSTSPDEIVRVMNDVDDEQVFEDLTQGITDALAELCGAQRMDEEIPRDPDGPDGDLMPTVKTTWSGGSPSHATLSALKYRPFMGFFGYLMENLMNPELSRSDTSPSQRTLRSV